MSMEKLEERVDRLERLVEYFIEEMADFKKWVVNRRKVDRQIAEHRASIDRKIQEYKAGIYAMAFREWEYMDILNFEEVKDA